MAGSIRTSSSSQLSADGDLGIDQFNVSAPDWPQVAEWFYARLPRRDLTVSLRWSVVSRLLLGLWICRGIAVAADTLGEYCFVLPGVLALFRAVQGAISVEVLPASFSPACHLGNWSGVALDPDQSGPCNSSGNRNHDIPDTSVAQQKLMDVELVAGLACVVHRCSKRSKRAEKLDRAKWKMQ